MLNRTTKKKELGIYYTPSELSDMLCHLTIGSPDIKILEPSFGGCAFLESISSRLKELGSSDPQKNTFGCDIDKEAFDHLKEWGVNGTIDHYKKKDFLKTSKKDFHNEEFDLVIGNPPYVSVHNVGQARKDFLRQYLKDNALPFTKKASLWAYFIMHSVKFLKEGGKVCFILPSIAHQNNYGKKVFSQLALYFKKIDWYLLDDEFFIHENIEEKVGILVAEGYSEKELNHSTKINYYTISKEEFYLFCQDKRAISLSSDLRKDKSSIYELYRYDTFVELGELVDVKIGAVTGDNNFFILTKNKIEDLRIDGKHFQKVVRRFGDLSAFELKEADFKKLSEANKRVWLLSPSTHEIKDRELEKYLVSYDESRIEVNKTFAKNENWWKFPSGDIPDAFFSYMSKWGASLILNSIKANCTNSVHKVFFKEKHTKKEMLLVSIALQSSYGQLSSELEARIYSSSVLKFEPTASKNIRIPNTKPYSDKIELKEVNNWIRNNLNTSRDVLNLKADEFLIQKGIITGENISQVRNTLKHLRKKRNPSL